MPEQVFETQVVSEPGAAATSQPDLLDVVHAMPDPFSVLTLLMLPAADYLVVGDTGHAPHILGIAPDPSGIIFVATDVALYALKVSCILDTLITLIRI
jgi:hypothetical protein